MRIARQHEYAQVGARAVARRACALNEVLDLDAVRTRLNAFDGHVVTAVVYRQDHELLAISQSRPPYALKGGRSPRSKARAVASHDHTSINLGIACGVGNRTTGVWGWLLRPFNWELCAVRVDGIVEVGIGHSRAFNSSIRRRIDDSWACKDASASNTGNRHVPLAQRYARACSILRRLAGAKGIPARTIGLASLLGR